MPVATSAVPRSTMRSLGGTLGGPTAGAIRTSITSGKPSGCASVDQTRKTRLRTRRNDRPGLYDAILYGPVAGRGVRAARAGAPAGTTRANGSASLYRNSASGASRWKVIVTVASSTTIPRERLHGRPGLQAVAPT